MRSMLRRSLTGCGQTSLGRQSMQYQRCTAAGCSSWRRPHVRAALASLRGVRRARARIQSAELTRACVRACVADAAGGDVRARPRAAAQSKLAIDESESAQLKRAKESYERHAERVGRGSLGRGATGRP
jgi:hypothetical protein